MWKRVGAIALVIVGVLGILLPVLPGVPFLIAGLVKLDVISKERVLALFKHLQSNPAPASQQ